ncbi:hypothetical protein IAR55_007130 [Kwoniella newhampshirensis]|uniref:Protein CPL1-like domain-containing protein n=1 Tax=Kwoniella newhampshirensis TaxID=1651941 RepID=A0AAW0YSD6_9TREE
MLSTITPIAILLLAGLQQVQAVYVACVPSATNLGDGFNVENIQNPTACSDACFNTYATTYSYFLPAQQGQGIPRKRQFPETSPPVCFCSDTSPTSQTVQPTASADTDGTGVCSDDTYTVNVVRSSYTFLRCYSGFGANTAPETLNLVGNVAGPEECFRACVGYGSALTAYGEGALFCACGPTDPQYSSPTTCRPGTYFIYYHSVGTTFNSQYAKRQLRERLVREKNSKRGICPTPLTACKVTGITDSFECINTNEELESCGGCVNGDFNGDKVTRGIDCTTLRGVARGGVTCSSGVCQAFACKAGFELSADATCLPL